LVKSLIAVCDFEISATIFAGLIGHRVLDIISFRSKQVIGKSLSTWVFVLTNMLPEALLAINGVRRVRPVGCNHILLAFVAFSFVKFTLVSESEAAFLSAFRAVFRPRQVFFLIKNLLLIDY